MRANVHTNNNIEFINITITIQYLQHYKAKYIIIIYIHNANYSDLIKQQLNHIIFVKITPKTITFLFVVAKKTQFFLNVTKL